MLFHLPEFAIFRDAWSCLVIGDMEEVACSQDPIILVLQNSLGKNNGLDHLLFSLLVLFLWK